jgi:hypothetical protein
MMIWHHHFLVWNIVVCASKVAFESASTFWFAYVIINVYLWVAPPVIGPANKPFPKTIFELPVGIATGSLVWTIV